MCWSQNVCNTVYVSESADESAALSSSATSVSRVRRTRSSISSHFRITSQTAPCTFCMQPSARSACSCNTRDTASSAAVCCVTARPSALLRVSTVWLVWFVAGAARHSVQKNSLWSRQYITSPRCGWRGHRSADITICVFDANSMLSIGNHMEFILNSLILIKFSHKRYRHRNKTIPNSV